MYIYIYIYIYIYVHTHTQIACAVKEDGLLKAEDWMLARTYVFTLSSHTYTLVLGMCSERRRAIESGRLDACSYICIHSQFIHIHTYSACAVKEDGLLKAEDLRLAIRRHRVKLLEECEDVSAYVCLCVCM